MRELLQKLFKNSCSNIKCKWHERSYHQLVGVIFFIVTTSCNNKWHLFNQNKWSRLFYCVKPSWNLSHLILYQDMIFITTWNNIKTLEEQNMIPNWSCPSMNSLLYFIVEIQRANSLFICLLNFDIMFCSCNNYSWLYSCLFETFCNMWCQWYPF